MKVLLDTTPNGHFKKESNITKKQYEKIVKAGILYLGYNHRKLILQRR